MRQLQALNERWQVNRSGEYVYSVDSEVEWEVVAARSVAEPTFDVIGMTTLGQS